MNHTFTTKTWGGNKPVSDVILIIVFILSVILMISIIGAPIGVILLFFPLSEYMVNMRTICPSCKKRVSVFRSAKAFSCYNCQRVMVKKNNQWVIMPEDK